MIWRWQLVLYSVCFQKFGEFMRCETWPVITGHYLWYSMGCEYSPHRSYCHPCCHWACRYRFNPLWVRIDQNYIGDEAAGKMLSITVSWRPKALAYSRDRPYNFSCLSVVSKNRRFSQFFLGFGVSFGEEISWPTMPVSNKKQEFEQRKRIKLFDDFWVRAYRFDFAPRRHGRCKQLICSFQFSAFWSNGLASSVFIFASISLRFFCCCCLRLCKG